MHYADKILQVWEQGRNKGSIERALLLFSILDDKVDAKSLAQLSIGERDAQLLQLRTRVFGDALTAVVQCEHCHESLEFTLSASALYSGTGIDEQGGEHSLETDDLEIRFRLPTSDDLRGIAHLRESATARLALFERCVCQILRTGKPAAFGDLSDTALAAVEQHISCVDPQADIRLNLNCPQCGHRWQASFDVGEFFWEEVDVLAKRLLREVHILAKCYGWSESSILSMSGARRAHYLDMLL